eukprot:12733917-Heterocapsa_arctica.AAC.1
MGGGVRLPWLPLAGARVSSSRRRSLPSCWAGGLRRLRSRWAVCCSRGRAAWFPLLSYIPTPSLRATSTPLLTLPRA